MSQQFKSLLLLRPFNSRLTSSRDPTPAVVDVGPHEGDDGHDGEAEAADVAQPEPGSEDEPGQDQDSRNREAIQKLKVVKWNHIRLFIEA